MQLTHCINTVHLQHMGILQNVSHSRVTHLQLDLYRKEALILHTSKLATVISINAMNMICVRIWKGKIMVTLVFYMNLCVMHLNLNVDS